MLDEHTHAHPVIEHALAASEQLDEPDEELAHHGVAGNHDVGRPTQKPIQNLVLPARASKAGNCLMSC